MNFNSLIPELSVTDINKTKDFYTNVLGFRLAYERPETKFAFLVKEDNQMMFEEVNYRWKTGDLEYPFGRGINFEMTVEDVEKLYNEMKNKGIKPFKELEEVSYRMNDSEVKQKQFLVQDPDGYLLRFVS